MERTKFGVRELAPALGSGAICGEQSGGKPPHSIGYKVLFQNEGR